MTWRTCRIHGDEQPNVYGCAECVREMRQKIADLERQLALKENNKTGGMMNEEDELLNILTYLIPDDFHKEKTICERVQLLVDRIADLERQLAEALAKARLWDKVQGTFRLVQYVSKEQFGHMQWESAVPGEIDESLKDAVRKLP